VPPAEPGALRAEWERRAAIVGSYREAAGITDPAQAIGPIPAGQAQLREAFHASVVALELPDEEALLRAMGQGQLEAVVAEHDRAAAVAPPDVQAEIGKHELAWESAQARAHAARYAMDAEAAAEADAAAEDAAQDLARLAVADAARREWAEAHAGTTEAARAAARELRDRGLAGRIPVTDAEVAAAEPEPRATPEIDPAEAARWKAGQAARVQAEREARAEASARACPVTDAEIEKYGREPEPEPVTPERAAFEADMAEIRAAADAIDTKVERIPDRDAERRAEVDEAGINEPVAHERQAGPELESAWQPGETDGRCEAAADAEAEIEM
jgi:hypothetical protein